MNKNQIMSFCFLLLAITLALGISIASYNRPTEPIFTDAEHVEPFFTDTNIEDIQIRHRQMLFQYMTLLYTKEPGKNIYTTYLIDAYPLWYQKYQANNLLGSMSDINLLAIQPVSKPDFYYPDVANLQKIHGIKTSSDYIDYISRLYACLIPHDTNQLNYNTIQENYANKMPYTQLLEIMYVSTFVPNALEHIYIMPYNEVTKQFSEVFQNYMDYVQFIQLYSSAEQMSMSTRDLVDISGQAVNPTNFIKYGATETPIIQNFMQSILYMYGDPKYVQGLQPSYVTFYQSLIYFVKKFSINVTQLDDLDILITRPPVTTKPLPPTTQPVVTTKPPQSAIADRILELTPTSNVTSITLPSNFPQYDVYVKFYIVGGGGGGGGGSSGKYNSTTLNISGSGGGSGSSGGVVIIHPIAYTSPITVSVGLGGVGGAPGVSAGTQGQKNNGTGGAGGNGGNGASTIIIINNTMITAYGGAAGTGALAVANSGGGPGTGGAAASVVNYGTVATSLSTLPGNPGTRGKFSNDDYGQPGGISNTNRLTTRYFNNTYGTGGNGGQGGRDGSYSGYSGENGTDGYVCAVFMYRPNGLSQPDSDWTQTPAPIPTAQVYTVSANVGSAGGSWSWRYFGSGT